MIDPALLPVNVTEQLPELSVQLAPVGDTPAPLAAKLTVPDGAPAVPKAVSDTTAVQVEPCAIATGELQLTTVELERLFTVSAKPALSELFACVLPLAV